MAMLTMPKRKAESSPGTPSTRKPLKKRLSFGEGIARVKAEVTMHYENRTETKELSGLWMDVAASLCAEDRKHAVHLVLQSEEAKEQFKSQMINSIVNEVTSMCDPKAKSLFRGSNLSDLQDFKYEEQAQELDVKAPLLSAVLHAAAESHRLQRNVQKLQQKLTPGITTAAGILLNCRSQNMNSHQIVTALVLKQSGAKKKAFGHLHSRFVCSSYKTIMQRQLDFGLDYDKDVKQWAQEKFKADCMEREIKESSTKEEWRKFQEGRKDCGYQLIMDNVDLVVHPRHTSREKHGTDLHMVQMIAAKNRVEGYHLKNDEPISTVSSIDLADFLPNLTDNKLLKHDWVLLIGNIISTHIPALQWFSQHIPAYQHHVHMVELRKKSEIVNLGVIMESENTAEGIYKIMHHLHKYTPGHGSDTLTPVISAGDLLTCERESSCRREQYNSTTPSQRLEGLIPVIADFHALANFYQVIWLHLYDVTSSGDKGTLYSARNFLDSRRVTSDPMKNVNAAADLISQYTDALVIAASMKYFGLEAVSDEPRYNAFEFDKHEDRTHYVYKVLEDIVDTYAIPSNDELRNDSSSLSCPNCNKKYQTQRGLKKHMKDKHPGIQQPIQHEGLAPNKDAVFNYTRTALSLCLMARDFNEARQVGDGERIIRLYKFLMLHFKAAKKPKYAHQALRLLAQVHCFLSPRLAYELTWNRFVNNIGKQNHNIEVDREIEHQNRVFKENCGGLRGKITAKSIDRISQSAQICDELLAKINQQAHVKRPSGKHTSPKTKDQVALALELHHEKVFNFQQGRKHFHFPDFTCSVLSTLNTPDLHKWMKSSLQQMSRDNI